MRLKKIRIRKKSAPLKSFAESWDKGNGMTVVRWTRIFITFRYGNNSIVPNWLRHGLRMAVNNEASDEQMAGRAWIRWSDTSAEPSDLPCLIWEKVSTMHSSDIETVLRSSAEREDKRETWRESHPVDGWEFKSLSRLHNIWSYTIRIIWRSSIVMNFMMY